MALWDGHQTRDLRLGALRWSESPAVTYSPHVDEAPAQEWVQVPVYAGQAGDVEDLVTQAGRDQEEEVQ